jgi:glycosyltransferase involved in cell wall biosynthesis
LKIVGEGPQYRELRRLAPSNVEFCGQVSEAELRHLYAHCRAVLLPGEEDFGIVPVESLASGKPVIALGRGGVLESVPARDPCAGFFYSEAGPNGLAAALREFDLAENNVNPLALQRIAQCFSTARFTAEMRRHLGLDEVSSAASASAAAI